MIPVGDLDQDGVMDHIVSVTNGSTTETAGSNSLHVYESATPTTVQVLLSSTIDTESSDIRFGDELLTWTIPAPLMDVQNGVLGEFFFGQFNDDDYDDVILSISGEGYSQAGHVRVVRAR